MTYCRSQNYSDKKIFNVCRRLEVERGYDFKEQHERVLGSEAFYALIVVRVTQIYTGAKVVHQKYSDFLFAN